MIGWAIWTTKVNQNAKKPPKSSKNEMLIFGLHSTSDDWLSDLSEESWPKYIKGPLSHQGKWNAHFWIMFNFWWLAKWSEWWKLAKMWKRPPKSSKNEMLISGLHSTSDDWLSNPSKEIRPKHKKGPRSQAMKINQNAKKIAQSHQKKWNALFGLCSTSNDQPSDLSNESWQKCTSKVPQNDLEQPISPDSQLFQSFHTEVAQDNSEWPISPDLQLFQSFPTEVAQNDSKWPILPNWQLFQSFPTIVAQNDLEWPILHGEKKKNTMIQGNFYERLQFYMDNCAISPTASLFVIIKGCYHREPGDMWVELYQ